VDIGRSTRWVLPTSRGRYVCCSQCDCSVHRVGVRRSGSIRKVLTTGLSFRNLAEIQSPHHCFRARLPPTSIPPASCAASSSSLISYRPPPLDCGPIRHTHRHDPLLDPSGDSLYFGRCSHRLSLHATRSRHLLPLDPSAARITIRGISLVRYMQRRDQPSPVAA
jgi:hypothetical protein